MLYIFGSFYSCFEIFQEFQYILYKLFSVNLLTIPGSRRDDYSESQCQASVCLYSSTSFDNLISQ